MNSTSNLACTFLSFAGVALAASLFTSRDELIAKTTKSQIYLLEQPMPIGPTLTLSDLYAAIGIVETGGEPSPDFAEGDPDGLGIPRSHGRYQISFAYWLDATGRDGQPVNDSWNGAYRLDVRDPFQARRLMLAYWRRYAPAALEALDFETLARTHAGGPDGARQDCTLAYWARVSAAMEARP